GKRSQASIHKLKIPLPPTLVDGTKEKEKVYFLIKNHSIIQSFNHSIIQSFNHSFIPFQGGSFF
ncbi:hypothetical protein, partial [Dyadobacter sp. SG02]|uniref:hypothetical protein n=1 Tax=Dyadobacter sp. SG02 TaxID=1855291 RepID=UPI001C432B4A